MNNAINAPVNIYSDDYIRLYLKENYPQKQIKSIIPYSFTVGSNNNGEDLPTVYKLERSMFYGYLYLNINPNENPLEIERIEIIYRSYFNTTPYYKHISRYVELENLINENSSSLELFDDLQIIQESAKYDFYLTFIGFKIDLL